MTYLRHLALSVLLVALGFVPAMAQTARVEIVTRAQESPLPLTRVRLGELNVRTDTLGRAVVQVAPGAYRLEATRVGFRRAQREVAILGDTSLVIDLEALEAEDEHDVGELEALVVTATRSEQRIEDAPVRVEVLAREEVEEKMMMTPGDVAMMLNETSGLRVQTTSPSLGGAAVRVQGLRGRYTQLLSDGLPLYGGQSGSLGLLQIPPMDLGQVEVIKGAASALYGASALGGVINLVSRRAAGDRELLLNASTLGGGDAVLWLSGALGGRWGYTFLGGAHGQKRADVDRDGWADVPSYSRGVVRPRLFWDGGQGRSLFLTAGGTAEDRNGGGDIGGMTRREELKTRRRDAGLVGRWMTEGGTHLNLRASGMVQRHDHRFGDVRERDRHDTWFAEGSAARAVGAHTLVGGAAWQQEIYRAADVPGFDYTFTIPSLFAQDDWRVAEWLAVTASGRVDAHGEYGTFFSPRLSALLRPAEGWTVRASAGAGYYAPTPFTEETESIGLTDLRPLRGLRVERARGASLDVGRAIGEIEFNASLFASVIDDALRLVPVGTPQSPGVMLLNVLGETRTWGTEALVRYHAEPWHVTATHTWTHASEPNLDDDLLTRREVPLTPRHQAGIVTMWEAEDAGRVGVEMYYTGRQSLDDNPYRTASKPYVVFGMLAERRVGRARVFVNAENLLDVRQTRWHPLPLPARSPELRWTTDAWAPLEGRAINAGVRLSF